MALATRAIYTELSQLSITGVQLRDLDNLPQEVAVRECPILFPDPDKAVGQSRTSRLTFGGSFGADWEDRAALRLRYLHAAVGGGRGLKDWYPSFLLNFDAIKTAILEGAYTTSGAIALSIDTTDFGPIVGPNNKKYYGCILTIVFWQQVHP